MIALVVEQTIVKAMNVSIDYAKEKLKEREGLEKTIKELEERVKKLEANPANP